MSVALEMVDEGADGAQESVLLLPGGMCSARMYEELMAEPALTGLRRVALTLPGHAGTEPPNDFSTEEYARLVSEVAKKHDITVVVGFSLGAMVAYEMAVSGVFQGPIVMLGASLSTPDEPAFFRIIARLGSVLGTLPAAVLKMGAGSMAKRAKTSSERKDQLKDDLARNSTRAMREWLRAYLRWLSRDDDRAKRLCDAGNRTWVVHSEKGDGDLTDHERAVLEACDHVKVITLPGQSFFLPVEESPSIAGVIADAVASQR